VQVPLAFSVCGPLLSVTVSLNAPDPAVPAGEFTGVWPAPGSPSTATGSPQPVAPAAPVPPATPVAPAAPRDPAARERRTDLAAAPEARTTSGADTAPPPPVGTGVRVTVHSVSVVAADGRCGAQVELRRGDDRAVGMAEGVMAISVVRRLVADATLRALAALDGDVARVAVDAIAVVPVGDHLVAVATVVLATPPFEEVLAGSAVVRGAGEHDAVARAVLDAGNRRLRPRA